MATITGYVAPNTLEEAAQALAEGPATVLAGGTDLLPRWSKGLLQWPRAVISLKAIPGLRGIARANGQVRIGAASSISEIASDPLVLEAAPVLAQAADRVACAQVRNRATIGGNLCNASPAADTAVPLILLDAVLELASSSDAGLAVREVLIADFFRGPGATVLEPGEILTHVRLPEKRILTPFSWWGKFGTRPAMEIAVASVGVAVELDAGMVADARVGYGSVAPVPLRGRQAEAQLVGNRLSAETIECCVAAARVEIAPIADVRASAEYRREVVGVMLRRMLEGAPRD